MSVIFPAIHAGYINTTDHLRRLRVQMKSSGYDAYIIPSYDEHQSEYVAEHYKRLGFISGFSGDYGVAVVSDDKAALWTSSTDFLQAERELDCNWVVLNTASSRSRDWIVKNIRRNGILGADSKLFPYSKWMDLKSFLAKNEVNLREDVHNLIDEIWDIPQGRVPDSISHIFIHDIKYAGKSWEEKVAELRDVLFVKFSANATVLTALDEIAWLFNLREDGMHTPVFRAYAFISLTKIKLYIKLLKVTPEIRRYLCPNAQNQSFCVLIEDYSNMFPYLDILEEKNESFLLSESTSFAVVDLIPEKQRILTNISPVSAMKSVKNKVEIVGMKNSHLKECVAIADFIAMLEMDIKNGKQWDEIKAAETLSQIRRQQQLNRGNSFSTISAVGPNAAIPHYKMSVATNRNLSSNQVYLLDTGGQYLDGTTDITRTFHFGSPKKFEVAAYTRVLMGSIDLMTAVFTENTPGNNLDILARQPLYEFGLEYYHGTSHGLGHFLSVHEGPIGISIFGSQRVPLKSGMFLSNEPGFYEEGNFGIRLETIMMVVKAYTSNNFDNLKFYTFEPVSFMPFEPKMIDFSLLSEKQKTWLNWFNARVRAIVGSELRRQGKKRALSWLLEKTQPVPLKTCRNHVINTWQHFSILTLIFCIALLL